MAIDTCTAHDVLATKRCPVCHRSLCSRCKTYDGCCSRGCFGRRQKHGLHAPVRRGQRPSEGGLFGALLKLAIVTAICVAVAKYFGKL